MVSIEIIGNLGADARVVDANGARFVSFNLADNRKVNGTEQTQWYGCNINRDCTNLMPYLKKGQCVFVRGLPKFRVFDSSVHHCKMVAVDVFVNEIQLVGGSQENKSEPQTEQQNQDDGVKPF